MSQISSSAVTTIATSSAKKSPAPGLAKVAQQFEAVFVRQMIASMRQGKLADDVFGSSATDSFQEMADARTADSLSALGRFGIGKMIEQQFQSRDPGR